MRQVMETFGVWNFDDPLTNIGFNLVPGDLVLMLPRDPKKRNEQRMLANGQIVMCHKEVFEERTLPC